jgi:hypothetical protein
MHHEGPERTLNTSKAGEHVIGSIFVLPAVEHRAKIRE